MENNVHLRVVRALKIVMFVVFGLNLVRIAYRTWKYGGSKELREDSFDFGEPDIEGVNGEE
jgi:hypothetical protein